MDQTEILAYITQVETEDIDPVNVAQVYAATLDEMQSQISNRDLQRLLLLGAAMFRNSTKGQHTELQMPGLTQPERVSAELDTPPKGILH